jgi:hypothetical protein
MLVLDDIAKLFDLTDDKHTIQLVKNKTRPEWCSLILFNNAKCRELRPAVIDDVSRDPFGLWWAGSVGALPNEWNHSIGYDDPRNDAKLVHFTQGVPLFPEMEGTEYVDAWQSELEASVHAESWGVADGKFRTCQESACTDRGCITLNVVQELQTSDAHTG